VDGARGHFLAGAGFAQHQHGGVERGDLLDQLAQLVTAGLVPVGPLPAALDRPGARHPGA
jgi:hypothetical protein